MQYHDYLASPNWEARKIILFATRFEGRPCCERCETHRQLHVHHITYTRIGHELNADLIVLCAVCHLAVHNAYDGTKFDPCSCTDEDAISARDIILSGKILIVKPTLEKWDVCISRNGYTLPDVLISYLTLDDKEAFRAQQRISWREDEK
jgi:hypothetical protein